MNNTYVCINITVLISIETARRSHQCTLCHFTENCHKRHKLKTFSYNFPTQVGSKCRFSVQLTFHKVAHHRQICSSRWCLYIISHIARSSTKMIAVNYQNDSCQLHYPKRERYYISSLCFEMARQMTLSTELS
jgi:hypothetical protein